MNKKNNTNGNQFKGLVINPSHPTREDVAVQRWQMKDELNEFEETNITTLPKIPVIEGIEDLRFLCDKPSKCNSFQRYGTSCRCIRAKFESPSAFRMWCRTFEVVFLKHLKQIIGDKE